MYRHNANRNLDNEEAGCLVTNIFAAFPSIYRELRIFW